MEFEVWFQIIDLSVPQGIVHQCRQPAVVVETIRCYLSEITAHRASSELGQCD